MRTALGADPVVPAMPSLLPADNDPRSPGARGSSVATQSSAGLMHSWPTTRSCVLALVVGPAGIGKQSRLACEAAAHVSEVATGIVVYGVCHEGPAIP